MASTTLLVAAAVFFALVATIAEATEVGGERVGGPPPLQMSSKDQKARACRTTGDAIVDIQSAVDGLSAMVVALSEEAGQGALLRAAAKVRAKLSNPSETTTASNEEAWKSASFLDGLVSHLATAPSETNGCGEFPCQNGISSLTASLLSPLRRSHDTLCAAERLAAPFHHADGGSNKSSISSRIARAVSSHDGEDHHHHQLPHQRQHTVASGGIETPSDANVAHFVLNTVEGNALRSRREDTAAARSYSCRWGSVRQAIRQGSCNFARNCTLFEDACEELPPESPLRVNLPQGSSALLLTFLGQAGAPPRIQNAFSTQLQAIHSLVAVRMEFDRPNSAILNLIDWPTEITTLQITARNPFEAFSDESSTQNPLARFANLQSLELSLKNTKTLAPSVFRPLSSLTWLSLRGSGLTHLKSGVFAPLPRLQTLLLRDNELTRLHSDTFSAQSNMIVLDLGLNSLGRLPRGVFDTCTSLRNINLFRNGLRSLELDVFAPLANLEILDIGRNSIATLDSTIFRAQAALLTLRMTANQLQSLPSDIFEACTSLRALFLSSNGLTQLHPSLFSRLTALSELHLDSNDLSSLPRDIFSAQSQLQQIFLRHNSITSLPQGIFDKCTSLENLRLVNNRIRKLDRDVFAHLTSLQSLAMNINAITQLPEGVFDSQTKLTELFLDRNHLRQIRSRVFQYQSQLTLLRLDRNRLNVVRPGAFASMTSLNRLWLFTNNLSTLPLDTFSQLQALEELRLSRNLFTVIPQHLFTSLVQLRTLRLEHNHVSQIESGAFANLTMLETLRLNGNSLTAIPTNIFADKAMLSFLDLSRNDLRDIPAGFFQGAHQLQELLVNDNHRLEFSVDSLINLENIHGLGMENIGHVTGNISSIFTSEIAATWAFSTLSIGWPGLNEETLPLETVCNVLAQDVSILRITKSDYERIESCPGKNIEQFQLSENTRLKTIVAGDHELLNASDSSQLASIEYATNSIPIVDVSGTSMRFHLDLCENLGTTLLLARNMRDIDALNPQRLLARCFLYGNAFDFSDNGDAFANLTLLDNTLPQRVVLGQQPADQAVFDDNGDEPQFRATVPIFLFDQNKIQCQVDFALPRLSPTGAFVPTFTTTCNCPVGFERADDGLCVEIPAPRAPIVEIVVGSAVAFSFFTLVVQYAVRWLKRKKRERYMLLEEKELQERLLSEATQEVAELKQGWKINLSEINLITKVDEGAFGAVWKGEWDGVGVAVKFLKLKSTDGFHDFMLSDIEKEVDFLQRTRHPNLVRFFGTGTDSYGAPFLVLEFVDFGSLKHLLHEKGLEEAIVEAKKLNRPQSMSLSDELSPGEFDGERDVEEGMMGFVEVTQEPASDAFESVMNVYDSTTQYSFKARIASPLRLKLCLVQDIADGMAFLHSLNVMHRDLKSGNVLVNKKLVAKITDFGSMSGKLATFQQSQLSASDASGTLGETAFDELQYSSSGTQATVAGMTMTAGVGTPLYMAPETLDPKNKKQTLKADVFSFGVLMWEICENRVPDLIEQELGSDFKGFLLQALFRLYTEGRHLTFADENASDGDRCPGWYRDLALACMSFGPSQRPTFEKIKQQLAVGQESMVV